MHEYRRFVHAELDARGWTPADLVHRSGLSRQLVWKVLHDDRPTLGQMPDESTLEGRVIDDGRLQAIGTQWVERPAAVCVPLMVAAWASGNGSKVYRSNFYEVPGDAWSKIYWFLFCAMLIYLLVWTLCGLLVLQRVPRHRPTVTVYLALVIAGIVVCTARIITQWCSWSERGVVGWLSTFAGGIIFAVAAARSWQNKTRWFKRRPDPDSPHRTPTSR